MTLRPLVCAAALALLAGEALAQAAPPVQEVPGPVRVPGQHPPDRGRRPENVRQRGPQLFISPSGEPFRGDDGLGAWFARADADHDGAIDEAEFRADAKAFFERLDANHDGVVDGFEMQAYEANVAPEIARYDFDLPQGSEGPRGGGIFGGGRRGGGRRGGGEGQQAPLLSGDQPQRPSARGREGAARWSVINEPEPVSGADADVDGRVSLAEWMAATDRRFTTLDRAKTGKLTLDQLKPLLPRQVGPGGRR